MFHAYCCECPVGHHQHHCVTQFLHSIDLKRNFAFIASANPTSFPVKSAMIFSPGMYFSQYLLFLIRACTKTPHFFNSSIAFKHRNCCPAQRSFLFHEPVLSNEQCPTSLPFLVAFLWSQPCQLMLPFTQIYLPNDVAVRTASIVICIPKWPGLVFLEKT